MEDMVKSCSSYSVRRESQSYRTDTSSCVHHQVIGLFDRHGQFPHFTFQFICFIKHLQRVKYMYACLKVDGHSLFCFNMYTSTLGLNLSVASTASKR